MQGKMTSIKDKEVHYDMEELSGKVPCDKCICLAVCKHKIYSDLIRCPKVFNFLYDHGISYKRRLLEVVEIFGLDPVYIGIKDLISQQQTFGSDSDAW